MRIVRVIAGLTSLALAASGLAWSVPPLMEASRFAAAASGLDPLTSLAVVKATAAGTLEPDLRAAVAADDLDLATSLLDLADARDQPIPADLRAAVTEMGGTVATSLRAARAFGSGVWSGQADTVAGFAGVASADLLLVGDVRDLASEAWTYAEGGEPDLVLAGISLVGLGLSSATIASWGTTLPARGSVSLLKMILKAPRAVLRSGARQLDDAAGKRGLRTVLAPIVADAVDPGALRRAAGAFEITAPRKAADLAAEVVDWRRVGALSAVATDFEKIRSAAGFRTAVMVGAEVRATADIARATVRTGKLGGKSLAVAWRAGDILVSGVFKLAGLVWDVLAGLAAAVFGTLHAVVSGLRGLRRLQTAG
jgi:hypothetical protein